MDYSDSRPIGDILKGRDAALKEQRNIILKNADAATAKGFTMVPNFILKSTKLSAGDKMTFAMLLSYAWQRDFCLSRPEAAWRRPRPHPIVASVPT